MAHWMKCENGCEVWLLVNDDAPGPILCDDCVEEAAVIAGELAVEPWHPDDIVRPARIASPIVMKG